MDDANSMECEVCGGTDFHKEAGHYYCNECQTQSQEVQEHVYGEQELITTKTSRKIQEDKSKKSDDALTSWECYNYILRGLTRELIALGANPSLKLVVHCLWMKYLHKCEVFDINSDRPPKLSVLGPKKDITILYSLKKRKRRRSRASSTSSLSSQRQMSIKRRALIQNQYNELSQSQTLTQDSSLMSASLSSLKSDSETSESGSKIVYNKYSNSELKRMMSQNHRKKHTHDMEGKMTCHKFKAKSFRPKFMTGPTNLTSFTLYCLLYIALLIIGDKIQLGDMLRFIREGHLSFACYSHFFDEHLAPKALNISQRKEKLFSHAYFRKRCAQVAQFLEVSSYLNMPDLIALCSRYCEELNLPLEVFECAEKLILKTSPKMVFNNRSKTIPNYEGRAMSFVLFCLKLLFGLDGVTERKFSEQAKELNKTTDEGAKNMFDFLAWLQFISYRAEVMRLHHLPTALKDCDSVDSDMYLSYLENQAIKFKGSGRSIVGEVQDYLQVLDRVRQEPHEGVAFEPSLTPFVDYTKLILDSASEDILVQNFAKHSIDFLLRPLQQEVKHGGANDNIVTEDLMYWYKSTICSRKDSHRQVAVKISNGIREDQGVAKCLENNRKVSLRTVDVKVLLSNWEKANANEFSINKDLLKLHTSPYAACKKQYNAFERYWLNLPTNPSSYYFPKQDMKVIAAKFPQSLKLILEECSRIVEQDSCQFFSEFLLTELYLVYFGHFGCKSKKDKSKGPQEIRATLVNCKRQCLSRDNQL